eukprot:bmy_01827T0
MNYLENWTIYMRLDCLTFASLKSLFVKFPFNI